jgi:hypothetical protein
MLNMFFSKLLMPFCLIISCTTIFLTNSYAQTNLKGSYDNLHLKKGNYVLTGKVYVLDSLLIDPGVSIQFNNNSNLTISGSALFLGDVNNYIVLQGLDSVFSEGIVIKSQSNADLVFKYVRFDNLSTAINFTNGWYRPSVYINNCLFVNNVSNSTIISLLNPYISPDLVIKTANMQIDNNNFSNNKSPIFFEDFYSQGLNISLTNNIFTDNLIGGNGFYTYYSNVIYGRLDKYNQTQSRVPFIYNNSFVNNYLYDLDSDTLVQKSNIGIYGTADTLLMGHNYFVEDSISGVYDNLVNYTSPRIINGNKENNYLNILPTHIVKMYDTSSKLISYDYDLKLGLKHLIVESNKPIDFSKLSLKFSFQNSDKLIKDSILDVKILKIDSLRFKLTFKHDTLFKNHNGFILISNLKGVNNDFIAETKIGYGRFLKNKFLYQELSRVNSIIEPNKNNIQRLEENLKRRFEFGVIAGYSLYNGTLSNKSLLKNSLNSSFGFNFKYFLNTKYSFSLTIQNTTLTGSDYKSGDSAKIRRGMSFKTPVINASVQVFRDFFNNKTYYKNKLIPSVGFGFGYTKFEPMGQFLGKWYSLNTLGTGGQLLPNALNKPYALSTLGSVISGELSFFRSKKIVIAANLSYHFTFTNYLDDVGPDTYPSVASILQNGGENVNATIYFSNPTGLKTLNQQLRSGAYDGFDTFMTFNFKISRIF